ncbi:hypothetical protein [Roseateles sp.]|uniref:hypothetical protein n=1 Tax=Roseateles sp. TaxID=1971397 RepID=UPI00286C298F|nr:hypothetical protein [Roseateles sp.]
MAIKQALTLVLTASVALLLSGCAGVPKPQLQGYATTYDEVKAAATAVYEDAAPALDGARGITPTSLAFPVTLGPGSFDREGCGRLIASDVDLHIRCQALFALKNYNQALLDLSSGKTLSEPMALIDNVGKSLDTILTLAPASVAAALPVAAITAAIPALKAVAGEALKAQDRAALLAKLLEGEPAIRAFIGALRTDINNLYVLHRTFASNQLVELTRSINKQLGLIGRSVGGFSPPTDPAVESLYLALGEKFERVFSSPEPEIKSVFRVKNLVFKAPGSAPALDTESVRLMEVTLSSMAENVTRFKAVGTRYQVSVAALTRFDEMLTTLEKSFNALIKASQQVFATGGGTEQALQSLAVLKDQAREIRRLLDTK